MYREILIDNISNELKKTTYTESDLYCIKRMIRFYRLKNYDSIIHDACELKCIDLLSNELKYKRGLSDLNDR